MNAVADAERATPAVEAVVCGSEHCITCGDDGVPMTVLRVDADRGLALCAAQDGERSSVETALVEPVAPGDCLLVHAGTAIARLEASTEEVAA
ncbi:MAG: HypC/HybG/HupF family hydrogenase formation chaperone [Solirubrobacteraceae bacterium]